MPTFYGPPSDGTVIPLDLDVEIDARYGHTVEYPGEIPAALGWPVSLGIEPSISVHRSGHLVGDVGVTPKELYAQFSQAQANPTGRYYAAPTGSDTNAGTFEAPWRSIRKCIEAANAGGVPARILITAGDYMGTNGFDGLSPTVDTAFVAAGGQVTVSTALASSAMTFVAHPTETNTYYITTPAAGVSRVLDLTRVDSRGNYVELTKVDGSNIANRSPGSYREGAELYINRADGKQPTAQNTRVLTTRPNFVLTSEVNVYIGTEDGSPWIIEGSHHVPSGYDPAAVMIGITTPTNTSEKAVVIENARIDYAGEVTAGANAVTAEKWPGIVALFNCSAFAATKDAFNVHNAGNLAARTMLLTVNCSSWDIGRSTSSSNGLTLHENAIGLDVAGDYSLSRGGTVHNIGTSKHYLLGTRVGNDLGDVIPTGGTIRPAGLLVNHSAEVWAEQVVVKVGAATYAYRTAAAASKIHRRDCPPVAQPDSGPGTIDAY